MFCCCIIRDDDCISEGEIRMALNASGMQQDCGKGYFILRDTSREDPSFCCHREKIPLLFMVDEIRGLYRLLTTKIFNAQHDYDRNIHCKMVWLLSPFVVMFLSTLFVPFIIPEPSTLFVVIFSILCILSLIIPLTWGGRYISNERNEWLTELVDIVETENPKWEQEARYQLELVEDERGCCGRHSLLCGRLVYIRFTRIEKMMTTLQQEQQQDGQEEPVFEVRRMPELDEIL